MAHVQRERSPTHSHHHYRSPGAQQIGESPRRNRAETVIGTTASGSGPHAPFATRIPSIFSSQRHRHQEQEPSHTTGTSIDVWQEEEDAYRQARKEVSRSTVSNGQSRPYHGQALPPGGRKQVSGLPNTSTPSLLDELRDPPTETFATVRAGISGPNASSATSGSSHPHADIGQSGAEAWSQRDLPQPPIYDDSVVHRIDPDRFPGQSGALAHQGELQDSLFSSSGRHTPAPARSPDESFRSRFAGQKSRSSSPKARKASPRPGSPPSRLAGLDRMFDRALQYFTDSDSNADKCPDDIWLLGVRHDGWRPDPPPIPSSPTPSHRPHQSRTSTPDSSGSSRDSSSPKNGKKLLFANRRRSSSKSSNSSPDPHNHASSSLSRSTSSTSSSEYSVSLTPTAASYPSFVTASTSSPPTQQPQFRTKAGAFFSAFKSAASGNGSAAYLQHMSQQAQMASTSLPARSPPRLLARTRTARKGSDKSIGAESGSLRRASSLEGSATSDSAAYVGHVAGTPISRQSTGSSSTRTTSTGAVITSASPASPLPAVPQTTHSLQLTSAQTNGWPPTFYHDFYSRIQLTYRSGFPGIPSSTSGSHGGNAALQAKDAVMGAWGSMLNGLNASIGRSGNAAASKSNERSDGAVLGDDMAGDGLSGGLTSDAGWGCMLRTGQSLLANALVAVHLGRDFRRPLPATGSSSLSLVPPHLSDQIDPAVYAQYVRLLTWFLDDPSPLSPFSIHAFALQGKLLGKQVGEWFGPSTAAGAIKNLANEFDPASMGVTVATDTTVYADEVLAIAAGGRPRQAAVAGKSEEWNRPVLILVPLRLGINGVNPIYHAAIKHYFTLPQCVGIAGGRPSSSYYFVGAQKESLFYIDPHHTKPAVKKVVVPEDIRTAAREAPLSLQSASDARERKVAEALDAFFAHAYSPQDLLSFHCEKVRKMSLSGLDPSMLVGLLCRDRGAWEDLVVRMEEFRVAQTSAQGEKGQSNRKERSSPIIHIAKETPKWMAKRKSANAAEPAGPAPISPGVITKFPAGQASSAGTTWTGRADESGEYADSDDWDIDDSDEPDDGDAKEDATDDDVSVVEKDNTSSSYGEVLPSRTSGALGALPDANWKSATGDRNRTAGEEDDEWQDTLSTSPAGKPLRSPGGLHARNRPPARVRMPSTLEDGDLDAVIIPPHQLPPKTDESGIGHVQSRPGTGKRQESIEPEDTAAGWEGLRENSFGSTRAGVRLRQDDSGAEGSRRGRIQSGDSSRTEIGRLA